MTAHDLLINRANLRETRLAEAVKPEIADGEVLLAVDAFSITSNNVTYAVFGDMMQYWNFFPAEQGWGRAPVWGFATVAESRAEGIAVGQKVYGYLPMSTWLKIAPGPVRNGGFSDTSPHRGVLSPVYNRYEFTATDPLYTPDTEALQMLFRPLFITSFLIDDFLADNAFFGAKQVIFSSASAKTAYATAQLLSARNAVAVTGLTSPRNVGFVKDLGCYGTVVPYDAIEMLDASVPTVLVDIAGDSAVRGRVHAHFNDHLTYSCTVGATHWDAGGGGGDLPGPKPQMFFAPNQIQKRHVDWGPAAFQAKVGEAWAHFMETAASSTRVVSSSGLEAAGKVFTGLVAGQSSADEGNVIILR